MSSPHLFYVSSKLCICMYPENLNQVGVLPGWWLLGHFSPNVANAKSSHCADSEASGWFEACTKRTKRKPAQVSTISVFPLLQRRLEDSPLEGLWKKIGWKSTVKEHSLCSMTLEKSLTCFHKFQDHIYQFLWSRPPHVSKPNQICAVQNGSQQPHLAI